MSSDNRYSFCVTTFAHFSPEIRGVRMAETLTAPRAGVHDAMRVRIICNLWDTRSRIDTHISLLNWFAYMLTAAYYALNRTLNRLKIVIIPAQHNDKP